MMLLKTESGCLVIEPGILVRMNNKLVKTVNDKFVRTDDKVVRCVSIICPDERQTCPEGFVRMNNMNRSKLST